MGFISKLMSNQANRYDPKFLIVHGSRDELDLNMQRVKFRKLDELGVKYEKFNSVMMVKHVSKELKDDGVKHYTVERW